MRKVVIQTPNNIQPIIAGKNTISISGEVSFGFNPGLPSLPMPPGCKDSVMRGNIQIVGNSMANAKMLYTELILERLSISVMEPRKTKYAM